MTKARRTLLREVHLWVSLVILASSLMIFGWARTYPVSYTPAEVPVLAQVSPLFWVGLVAGFVALAGLVLTTESAYAHWLASCLFVLFLSAPQFLYLSWGSDAGVLPDLVEYVHIVGSLDLGWDVIVHSYFQWPASILFHTYLADLLGVGQHAAVQIGFLFVAISVGGGLFVCWFNELPITPNLTRAAFWGLVLYFAGFYWLFNWQAVPYSFSLALFFPMLALLRKRTWHEKGLLLLFFLVGIECHALYGVWSASIVAVILVLDVTRRRDGALLSLLLFLVVAQVSVIVYKNTRFFGYVVHSLQGTYQAFLEIGSSDRALIRQISAAVSPLSNEPTAALLKALSWCDLVFVTVAFIIGAGVVILRRRVRHREIALFGTGSLHFLLGIVLAAIGTRSLQLVGMVPAFFAADALAHGGSRVRRAILLASLISLLLFPAAVIRSHQTSPNYVRPSNLLVQRHLASHSQELSGRTAILDEGRIHTTNRLSLVVHNPRTAKVERCTGPYIIADTPQFRHYVASVAGCPAAEVGARLDRLNLSAFYTNGAVTLRSGRDCRQWHILWE